MAVACGQLHPRPVTNRPAAGAPALRLVAKGGLASERYVSEVAAAVASVTRTCRLSAGEAEDLQSDLWVRLLEHDGRVLRSFRGRARIGTYLVTIARNLVFDRRNKEWGRWRPSSAARRAGPEAVELERLMSRDGWTLDAAAESLKLAGTLSVATLAATLARTLPVRTRRHFVDVSVLESIPAHGSDPGGTSPGEQEQLASELQRVLAGALDTLSEYDRRLLSWRFVDGITVAAIAAMVKGEAKILYRRFYKILRQLRESLESAGMTAETVRQVLADAGPGFECDLDATAGLYSRAGLNSGSRAR
jgi:RNA polymerase sigma factor for flagellar operon FliA